MEKPTWGQCMYAVPEGSNRTESEGRFTWANNTCEHFKVRESIPAAR
jgi:hypothetical protein